MWVIKAVDSGTGRTVAWVLGQRDEKTFRRLYDKVKHLKNCIFYTDNWDAFAEGSIHDTKSGGEVFKEAIEKYPTIQGCCADESYRKTFENVVLSLGKTIKISEKIKPKGWAVLPRRWVVERTFAWANNSRRLSKDYEITSKSAENIFIVSHIHSLLRRF